MANLSKTQTVSVNLAVVNNSIVATSKTLTTQQVGATSFLTGPAGTASIGTVTTLAAGASATVTNTGTASAAVLNFGIPTGAAGPATNDASALTTGTLSAARLPALTGDVTSTAGSAVTSIAAGVIINADVNSAANIDATKLGTGLVNNTEFNYLDGVTSAIQTQLNSKASLASPTFTGTPTTPTPTAGDNTTNIASTAFVTTAILNAATTYDDVKEYANLGSFPGSGATGNIYVADDTGFLYRWSGSTYIQVGGGTAADATTSSKGIIQLAGDLGGTAASPTVPGLAAKLSNITGLITAGTNITLSGSGTSGSPYSITATSGGTGSVSSVSVTTANGVSGTVANPTTTPAISLSLGAITPSSVVASGSVTGSNLSGTNTGDQTNVSGNAGTATTLATARTIGTLTGDVTTAGSNFNGSANNTNATVLATVNSNVGSFGSATAVPAVTVNAKGLTTAVVSTPIQIAESQVTNLTTDLAAKQPTISLTTAGTSGAATFISNVLNIPQYTGGGGGGSGITRSVANVSTNTAAGSTASVDYVYNVTTTATVTLPTAIGNTSRYTIKNVGTGTVTVNTTSSQTMDGSTTASWNLQYASYDFVSDGSNWTVE